MLTSSTKTDFWRTLVKGLAVFSVGASVALSAQDFHSDRDKHGAHFWPGNLVVSRSVYDNNRSNVKVGTILSPNCANTTGGCAAATGAPYNGAYPLVWNNDT
jgi:hypothetical protein